MRPVTPPTSCAGHYDHVISLGRACQPAHQIRRILGIATAHVFDWIITTDPGLLTLVDTNLDGLFSRDKLGVGTGNCIVHLPTDTRFLHEFPRNGDIDAHYGQHDGRFAMLIERWRTVVASDARVLFVRQHAWAAEPRTWALHLQTSLRRRGPRLTFELLYLTNDPLDDLPWGLDGIVNRHLTQPEPYRWEGDDAAWERLLEGVRIA